ncbi:MAG: T9SS type A sorting domain-containing protein [Bacteroidetes bacterium]|jgi:endonuclease/exonuclease/phosphatase family metal-dependent hydrolase|nr:T9SS type A sorting domain-containing protein [Bacteroidota bacterium]
MPIRYVLLIALCGFLVLPAAAQTIDVKGSDASLDVAAWNIEWFGSASNGPSDDAQQLANVRAVIEQADIDLWAVQEMADTDDFQTLLDQLGDDYDGVLASNSGQQRIGFVWKTALFSVRRIQHILEDEEYEFAFRPPLLMETDVTLPDTTVRVTFITVHMKAPTAPSGESYDRRVAASQALKDHIDFLRPSEPIIVLGDFNDELGRSVYLGNDSPYENFVDDPDDYFFPTLDLDQQNVPTFCNNASCSSGSTLDHILVTNELAPAYLPDSGQRFEELIDDLTSYTRTTSDHLPVLARFQFSQPDATEPTETPGVLTVDPAYPNPFRTVTTVSYALSQPSPVRIEAFDLLGRRVATLTDQTQPPGDHRVRVDASEWPPGLYVLRMTVDATVHTQRVVHLR